MPIASNELILYQLSELKSALREGFSEVKGEMGVRFEKVDARFEQQDRRFGAIEERMAKQERFRDRVEQREKAEVDSASMVNQRWIPIVSILAVIVMGVISIWLGLK